MVNLDEPFANEMTNLFLRVSIDQILVLNSKEVELVNRQEMESRESSIQKLVSRVHQ